jgi:hypothetical protein
VRARVTRCGVRTLFWTYVTIIVTGVVFYLVVGLGHY